MENPLSVNILGAKQQHLAAMTMDSAEYLLDMILMKQMAGITKYFQTIQAMPEPSGLGGGDSTDSSVTNLVLEEPEAMQSEAIEKEVISIAGIPAAAAGISAPPGGESTQHLRHQNPAESQSLHRHQQSQLRTLSWRPMLQNF